MQQGLLYKVRLAEKKAFISGQRKGYATQNNTKINQIVIPHFIYFQIHCTFVKFNKAPVSNKLTFIASDSLIPGRCMLS